MLVIDLSFPRRFIQSSIKDIKFNMEFNEHKFKSNSIVAIGTLASLLSFQNITLAEGLKNSTNLIENNLYPNLFALCEIIKQSNYYQLTAGLDIFKNDTFHIK